MAAEKGNVEAQVLLGEMFKIGEGGKRDLDEFMRWTGRAGLQDHPDALNALGVAFHNGEGVPKDFSQAMKNYRKAADLGSDWAMRNIGFLLEQGQGVGADAEEAAKWYRRAAAAGNSDACRSLALMYATGKGVPKNLVEAYLLYSLAAELAPEGRERGAITASRTKLAKKMTQEEISQAEDTLRVPAFFETKRTSLDEGRAETTLSHSH
ncbi:MAG: sel1 repeat family protein [Armatimonadetes bacterium]|nr:sel1 repeat family protein [Armatimonadota bacterium]